MDVHAAYYRFKRRATNLPKPLRILVGLLLVVGGLVGFLPILGLWMLPLGLVVLSVDFPPLRRLREKFEAWWDRRASDRQGGA